LRASERLGLEWSSITNLSEDIDKPAVLTIDRQLYNDAEARKLYIKRQTKTNAGTRQIPLPDDVRVILIDHKARQLEQKKSPKWKPKEEFHDLIYTTDTGNAIRQSTDNEQWRKFIEDVGLQPLRGHDMRHLTASWLAKTGVSAEIAKTILGHNSEAMTSYYTHISLTSKSLAIAQLNSGYDKALDKRLLASKNLDPEATNTHAGLMRAVRELKDREGRASGE
jgi:integrase